MTGRRCFDIAESNDNSESGPLSGRTWKADFALPDVHTQNYIFTSSETGTVKNVRYAIQDPQGVLSSSQRLSGWLKLGDMPNSATIPLTLEFKNTLNSPSSDPLIVGLTRENADSVFLPAAGCRSYSNGALGNRGTNGFYWSSTYMCVRIFAVKRIKNIVI